MDFLQSRQKSLLLSLLTTEVSSYISTSVLAERLAVTPRTIRNDVVELNKLLQSYEAKILNKRGSGLYIECKNKRKIKNLKSDLLNDQSIDAKDSLDERLKSFVLLILSQNNSIDELINQLYISDSTFDKYLNEARKLFRKYDLKLSKHSNRIEVTGTEANIRSCIIDNIDNKRAKNYVRGFSKAEKNLFKGIDLNKLSNLVVELINKLSLEISDFNVKNIVIHIALEIVRLKNNQQLENFDRSKFDLKNKYAKDIYPFFERMMDQYQLKYGKNEKLYFVYHLALNYPELIAETGNMSNDKRIDDAIINFLDRIKDNYLCNLVGDKKLIANLHKHLNLLLRVQNIDGNRKNPLLNVIISTFPLAYEMTVTAAPILENRLGLKLDVDELSFITLHIGASLERLYDNRWEKKRVVLVCGSGTATALLLKARLETEFSEYISIIGIYSLYEYEHTKSKGADFVVSTVPIYKSSLPVIQLDLSNFQKDSFELYQYLVSISSESKLIMNLFDSKLIYLIDKRTTKKELLNLMIFDQEKYEYVNSDFRENVYIREKMYSSAIGGEIAIPHPIKYSAIQSKVSFVRLKYPVEWDDKNKVKYVFLLSINKNDYPHMQQLFALLVDLQSNIQFRNLIDKCKTVEDTKEVLRTMVQDTRYEK
ncbi:MAG: PTS sugar transporter subunit IIA [Lactobacillus sp.]|uniref:BglG family transcription antiterminator n=1 Tax=Lactobacillus sp. TaxID=1591 RepID=UPI0023D58083|nr:PTS sugar transporter subunit IIA [Lactobacillus sp.]MDE7050751.1 PTS sugar transporter subunit IIA [Lactobacillus sp.]